MTTTLQRQLAALAAPSSSLLVPERRRSSILFSPQDAAKYDKETFHQLGLDGLHELIAINSKLFEPFEDSILFKDDSKRIERVVEDAEFNAKLDEIVNNFLTALYPYMMIKASLKCLEWLVYRFHIERFNVEGILRCVLPYYDTKTFVMVVQVLEIERFQQNQEWEWIIPCIQSGAPLRKAVLFDNCNSKFILWLFSSLNAILSVHKYHPENLRVFLGFMSSTIVGILNKFKADLVSHPHKIRNRKFVVLNILNQIFGLLKKIQDDNGAKDKKNNDEIFSMTYILMGMISVCCNEIPELHEVTGLGLKKILRVLSSGNRATSQKTETYLLINILLEHSSLPWMIPKYNVLTRILNDVAEISQEWDVSVLATKLLLSNLEMKSLSPVKILDWVKEIQLSPSVRSNIVRTAYYHYLSVNKNWALLLLTHFERQYPIEYEMATAEDPQFAAKLVNAKAGKDYVLMCQDSDPKKRIRGIKMLLKKLLLPPTKSIVQKGKLKLRKTKTKNKKILPDKNPTANALLPRFLDDSDSVVLAVLKPKLSTMQQIFTEETLANAYIDVLKKHYKLAKKPSKLVRLVTKKMCGLAHQSSNAEFHNKVINLVLPMMFPTTDAHMKLSQLVMKTNFAKDNNFLTNFVTLIDHEDLTAKQMQSKFFEIARSINDKSQHEVMLGDSPVQLTFACLWLSPSAILNKFIRNSSSKIITCKRSYPIEDGSFKTCLELAHKRDCLSLELVLTTLCQSKVNNKEDVQDVVRFVWRSAEMVENRDSCMKFLSDFLKINFDSPVERLLFWVEMLRTICYKQHVSYQSGENSSNEDTLYKIRAIQFIDAYLQKHALLDIVNQSQKNSTNDIPADCDVKRPVTRNQKALLEEKVPSSPKKNRGKQSSKELAKTDSEDQHLLWNITRVLLTHCLSDATRSVREVTFNCLSNLKSAIKHEIGDFIEYFLDYRAEIITDYTQLSNVVGRALSDDEFSSLLQLIFRLLKDPNENEFDKLRLIEVMDQCGTKVLKNLVPLVHDMLQTSPDSLLLRKLLGIFDATLIDETLISASLTNQHLAKLVTKKIDRSTFEQYNPTAQKNLLSLMIDQSLQCKVPEIKIAIQRCVRKWALDCSMISHELVKCIGMERRTASQALRLKDVKANTCTPTPNEQDTPSQKQQQDWLARAEIILEFVQGKKHLIEKSKLIQPLFRLLKMCMEMEEQSPEYLKQLVLSSLTICCQNNEENELCNPKGFKTTSAKIMELFDLITVINYLDLVNFNVDAVISCLRESNNPQTHHHGLILLNYAAKLFPEQVLHGVMSLFTFMGNHMIRQDDTYSTQLIQQTVYTIIPSLVSAGKGKLSEASRLVVAAGIFRVFASAVQDIPVHRRLPIFTSLVQTLQPDFSMWLFCIIVVDSALQRDKKKSNLNADLELAVNLVWSFEPSAIVSSMDSVYKFLLSLPIYKPSISDKEFESMKLRQNELERNVLDFRGKESLKDVLIVVHYVLELISHICSKFADVTDSRVEYDHLLEKCLNLSRLLGGLHDDKLYRLLTHKNLEVVDKVNNALQPTDFIEVVALILVRDDMTVKRKVMEMLNQRLLQKIEWFGDPTDLLDLLPHLLKIVDTEPQSDEETTVVQTAFLSLKLMARHLAVQNPEAFIPVFKSAMNQTEHSNKLLCASALLCTGELCCLKSLILPDLQVITKSILKAFKTSGKTLLEERNLEALANETENADNSGTPATENTHQTIAVHLLCTSAVTCLNKMVEHLGSFVGVKFLKRALVAILTIRNRYGDQEKTSHKKKILDQKITVLFKSISTKIPIRNSLTSIRGAFCSLRDDCAGLCSLIKLLQDTLQSTSKADFSIIIQSLMDSFLEDFLTYRVSVAEEYKTVVSGQEINIVEDEIIACMINGIVLKMSESHFRPLYHKMFDWTGDNVNKLITFYRLSAAAAEKLKSLFVTFAGYVVNKAVGSLKEDLVLTRSVTKFLFHIFSNDREGFITHDRFNSLVKPLVDLVESKYVINGELPIQEVNETLIQLAVATNDLNRWQYLIELLSFRSNHPNKIVRLHVISTLEAAANELSKDFLTLLPPAVPFLAELMNDDDAEVESEAQKLILKLEEIVGEPLQPYFTT